LSTAVGSAANTHLEVDAAAAALVAVSTTRCTADGSTAASAPAGDALRTGHPQHHGHH